MKGEEEQMEEGKVKERKEEEEDEEEIPDFSLPVEDVGDYDLETHEKNDSWPYCNLVCGVTLNITNKKRIKRKLLYFLIIIKQVLLLEHTLYVACIYSLRPLRNF